MPKPVLSKRDFVRRYSAGEFGNAALTWDNVASYLSSSYQGLVHLRSRQKGESTLYNQSREQVNTRYYKPGEDWYVSGMCPHHRGTIQGEVQQGLWGLDLTWTTGKLPMRQALASHSNYSQWLKATNLLRCSMNDLSYRWLQWLFEAYPNHVVEFTCLNTCWGTVPGHNTIFWEVRKY